MITEVGHVTTSDGTVTIDGEGLVATPGLVNAHTHSGQHLDRGVAPNLPLDLWLMWVVYGGVEFSPDDSYTLALSGALEMTRTGCTSVLDHPWVPADGFDEHIDALDQRLRRRRHPMRSGADDPGPRHLRVDRRSATFDAPAPLGRAGRAAPAARVDGALPARARRPAAAHADGRSVGTAALQRRADARARSDGRVARRTAAHPRARDALAGVRHPRALRAVGGGVPRRHRRAHRPDEPRARRVARRGRVRARPRRRLDDRAQPRVEPALRIRTPAVERPARGRRERGARSRRRGVERQPEHVRDDEDRRT